MPAHFVDSDPKSLTRRDLGGPIFASHPERLIRISRLVTSSLGLLAVWFDPTQPTRNVTETYTLLAGYMVYAAYLVVKPSRHALNHRSHIPGHMIDILILCILAFLSGELASPFYAYFTFALITGAMRWGVRGALITAVALDVLLVPVGWPYADPSVSDLNVLIMRSAYALVAAVMLGYFASYRERSRSQLARLAAWPVEAQSRESEPAIAGSLRHASDVLDGAGLLVVWRDEDEPFGQLAWWDGAECTNVSVEGDGCQRIIEGGHGHAAFGDRPLAEVLVLPEETLPPSLRVAMVRPGRASPGYCSVPFVSSHYAGRVFVIDPGSPSEDILSLAEIVATRLASEFEQITMMRELEVTASLRERGRLARDLHDSVLQDLTAAGLQLKTASQRSPEAMRSAVVLVGGILAEQQRQIRRFVEQARSAPPRSVSEPLVGPLQTLAEALGRQWHCLVEVAVEPAGATLVPPGFADLCQIISEATANAVRHGGASLVHVLVTLKPDGIELAIRDDGCGVAGDSDIRPRSINDRVDDLGGELVVHSTDEGFNMHIRLPS